jgi:hypothetical protein
VTGAFKARPRHLWHLDEQKAPGGKAPHRTGTLLVLVKMRRIFEGTMKEYNWFERHSKLTIASLLLLIILILTFATETLLGYRHELSTYNFALPNRAIRLREFRPFMVDRSFPSRGIGIHDTLAYREYVLRIDKNGFVIPSEKYVHPDLSLVFLGGSTTTCQFVGENLRFPCLAGVLLEKKLGLKINSYNASRVGNNSLHSIDILINKIIPINPQIVVMMHNVNDLTILLYEKSYWNNHFSRSPIIDINNELTVKKFMQNLRDRLIPNIATQVRILSNRTKEWLRVSDGNNDEFAAIRGKRITFNKAEIIRQFEMNLQMFICICKSRNIVPVLMTMPNRLKEHPDKVIMDNINERKIISYHDFKDLFDSLNAAIVNKARENHITLIDLASAIPQENKYMYDMVHYTDAGSEKIAHIVADHLIPIIKTLPQRNEAG